LKNLFHKCPLTFWLDTCIECNIKFIKPLSNQSVNKKNPWGSMR
jgi:hypothetical protein